MLIAPSLLEEESLSGNRVSQDGQPLPSRHLQSACILVWPFENQVLVLTAISRAGPHPLRKSWPSPLLRSPRQGVHCSLLVYSFTVAESHCSHPSQKPPPGQTRVLTGKDSLPPTWKGVRAVVQVGAAWRKQKREGELERESRLVWPGRQVGKGALWAC